MLPNEFIIASQNGNTLSWNWYDIHCCGSIITIIRTIKHFNFVENIFNIRKTDVSTLHFGAYLIFESFWTYTHIFQFHFRISETNRNVTFIQLETNRNITFIQSNYFKCTSTIYSLISPWYKLEVLVKLKYDVALRFAWKKLTYIDYAMKILARNRARIYCLKSNNANHYTSNACCFFGAISKTDISILQILSFQILTWYPNKWSCILQPAG